MGLLNFLRNPALSVKESLAARVIFQGTGQARWTEQSFENQSRQGYQRNVIAFRCVNIIADAVASVQWEIMKGDSLLEDHPYYNVLRRPNPAQSGHEFMRQKISYLMIGGNSYDERIILGGDVREKYTLRPDRMKIFDGPSWPWPSKYVYTAGSNTQTWEVDPKTGTSDIRHMKLFNPTNDWYGQSPLVAGTYGVDQHNEAMTWIQALLQNSARPSGALVMSGSERMGDEQFDRMKAQIDSQYSGASNAGRPMLLEGGLDWKEMGMSPSDMAITDTKNSAAIDIATAFGVPAQLVGIPQSQTYNSYPEARLSFWEDTIIPLVQAVGAEESAWMQQVYGDDVRVVANLDKIPAIVDKRAKQWEAADKSTDLTVNERRELKGFPEIHGGDEPPATVTLQPSEVAELHRLALSVADGMLPAESAIAIAKAAHPHIGEEIITSMIMPAKDFQPSIEFDPEVSDDLD